jgi:hypothetical protein
MTMRDTWKRKCKRKRLWWLCSAGLLCVKHARFPHQSQTPDQPRPKPLYIHIHTRTQAHAALYSQAFQSVLARGLCSRPRARLVLRAWSMLAALADADVTWGLGARVGGSLGIGPAEVEDPALLALETLPGDAKCVLVLRMRVPAWLARLFLCLPVCSLARSPQKPCVFVCLFVCLFVDCVSRVCRGL